MSDIHHHAAAGFAKEAASYAAGRPDYPVALGGWLMDVLGLGDGKRALDLGAGTGKFAPLLWRTGAQVTAVEPVAEMRAQLAAANPGVAVLAGTADEIPLPDESVDAVVCAQAFHWFATAAAVAEIRRVLRPGGALGLVWNVRDERVPWVAELTRIVDEFESDAPRYRTMAWRAVFPALGFGPLVEHSFQYGHTGPAERVIVDRVRSTSFIAALLEPEREAVIERVRTLIAATPALAGKDVVTYPYVTLAASCRRTS